MRLTGRPLCLAFAVLAALAAARGAAAQPADPSAPASREERARQLEAVRDDQKRAGALEAKIRAEVEAIRADRRMLAQAVLDAASRVRSVEGRIAATEARLPQLDADEARARAALDGRQKVLADLLAVLQRMGRKPPPALLARPEDVLEAVRSAVLIGSLLPGLKDEAQSLAKDLSALLQVRREIAEQRQTLNASLAALGEEQQRLTTLMAERQRQEREGEQAADEQRQKARDLARQAETLEKLIADMEAGPAAKAAEAAAQPPEKRGPGTFAALRDPARLAPAVPFAQVRGLLPLPVNGVRLREFGDKDARGGTERGLSVATRVNAQVTSPCDGWVVFAGPFRSYGQLLIINAGGGYHILLAGMDRITAQLGQFVLTGEPVGVMGGGPQAAAVVAIGTSQPTLYIEFRKDGTAIDPGPWWMTTESEKVRG